MITIGHYQSAVKAADLIQRASDVYMYLLPIAQPITGLARLGAREWVSKPAWKNAGKNLLEWFFLAFINRLGAHLIELYSGRLAIGAETYRKLREARPGGVAEASAGGGLAEPARGVFIAAKGPGVRRRIEALRETALSNLNAVRDAAAIRGVRLDPRGLVESSILSWSGPVDPAGQRGAEEIEKAISTADLVVAWIDPESFEPMLTVLTDPPKASPGAPNAQDAAHCRIRRARRSRERSAREGGGLEKSSLCRAYWSRNRRARRWFRSVRGGGRVARRQSASTVQVGSEPSRPFAIFESRGELRSRRMESPQESTSPKRPTLKKQITFIRIGQVSYAWKVGRPLIGRNRSVPTRIGQGKK